MAGTTLPESYRQLNEFAVRYAADAVVCASGERPARFFVVLSGTIRLSAEGSDERPREVARGEFFGVAEAFAGVLPATDAIAVGDAAVIVVPVERAAEAFALSPDLAVEVSRHLATRVLPQGQVHAASVTPASTPKPAANTVAAPVSIRPAAPTKTPADAVGSAGGWIQALTKLSVEYDESFFFKDSEECPACGSRFECLRVRTAGVQPQHRDSDFHVTYRSDDPARYGILVCPTCSYAATHEDFSSLPPDEREAIVANSQARGRYDYPNLGGPRTAEDAIVAFELAQSCYAVRAPSPRRDAGLLHRRAWLERERGDEVAEREWLSQARDAYRQSFELDGDISEESAMRVAYLIGELSLRLDEPILGAQWLETAVRFPEAKRQTGLARQARDRLSDARKLLAELDEAEPA